MWRRKEKDDAARAALVNDCLRFLRKAGFVGHYEPVGCGPGDGWLALEREGSVQRYRLAVQVKAGPLARQDGDYWQYLVARGGADLLCADAIPPAVAAGLKDKGIQYIDRAGNMFLDAPGIYVHVVGQRRPRTVPSTTGANVFHVAGLRLLLLLLKEPEAVNWPQRRIAMGAGIAQGNIPRLFRGLEEQGFLVLLRRGERRLVSAEKLLARWEEGYVERLRSKLFIGRYEYLGPASEVSYVARQVQWYQHHHRDGWFDGVALGGELAATIRHPDVFFQPMTAAIHVPVVDEAEDTRKLTFLLAKCNVESTPSADGNVTVLRRVGTVDGGEPGLLDDHRIGLIDPLLMYAEMALVEGGREERMGAMRERLLAHDILPRLGVSSHA